MDYNDKKAISGGILIPGKDEPFAPAGFISRIDFALDDMQPTRGVYVRPDDKLLFHVTAIPAGPGYIVSYRILDPDGQVVVSQSLMTQSAGTQAFFTAPLIEGVLLAAAICPNGAGGTQYPAFGSIMLLRGATSTINALQQLCSGYLYTNVPLSYPDSGREIPNHGNGFINNSVSASPAAGADINLVGLGSCRFRHQSVTATLTTSATVGNRVVQFLIVNSGGGVVFASTPAPAQAASLAWQYTFANFGYAPVQTGTSVSVHTPDNVIVGAGGTLKTLTAGIQPGDQWSLVFTDVQMWVDVP